MTLWVYGLTSIPYPVYNSHFLQASSESDYELEVRGTSGDSSRVTKTRSFDKPRKPQMFLLPYILFLHKESYLTILMFIDYPIVTEFF